MNMMTQEKADKIFKTSLGVQLAELFSTADGRVFIRREEALLHAQGKLDQGTKPLEDQTINVWYPNDDYEPDNIDIDNGPEELPFQ